MRGRGGRATTRLRILSQCGVDFVINIEKQIRDDLFEDYRKSSDFIKKYVFPGGMLPSEQRLRREVASAGLIYGDVLRGLWLISIEHEKDPSGGSRQVHRAAPHPNGLMFGSRKQEPARICDVSQPADKHFLRVFHEAIPFSVSREMVQEDPRFHNDDTGCP